MFEAFEFITVLQADIGKGAIVSLRVLMDGLVVRVDWPDDYHVEFQIKEHHL